MNRLFPISLCLAAALALANCKSEPAPDPPKTMAPVAAPDTTAKTGTPAAVGFSASSTNEDLAAKLRKYPGNPSLLAPPVLSACPLSAHSSSH